MIKGKLITVKGDVTDPQKQAPNEIVVISHVCNNFGVMGAGVALALRKKWEKVYTDYENYYEREVVRKSFPILGRVCYSKIDEHLVIANMIAQNGTVSSFNPKPIKYKALINCMAEVIGYIEMIKCQTSNPVVIHCPKFGSDLAGGTWEFILELIDEIWLSDGIDVVVYEFGE